MEVWRCGVVEVRRKGGCRGEDEEMWREGRIEIWRDGDMEGGGME